MANIFSRRLLGDVVFAAGNRVFRKLQESVPLPPMDVFFDFRNVGNNLARHGTGFTLPNQGTDANVSFASCFPYSTANLNPYLETVEGEGLKTYCDYGPGHSYFKTAGFNVVGLDEAFMRGAKTVFFKMSAASTYPARYVQIVAHNSATNAMIGLTPQSNGYNYHDFFVKENDGGAENKALALTDSFKTSKSVVGLPTAGSTDTRFSDLDVIITIGSEEEPSPAKIYIGGELVGIFEGANYCDLYSSDGLLRCFVSTTKWNSSQDFISYTIPYFGMIRGELSEDEVKALHDQLGAGGDLDDGNLSDIPGVYEGPLSKVGTFVSVHGLSDVLCVADIDGQMLSVPGGELTNHFASFGFVAEDIVRFEYPT